MTVPINPGDVIDGTNVSERLLGMGGLGAVFHRPRGTTQTAHITASVLFNPPGATSRFEERSPYIKQSN